MKTKVLWCGEASVLNTGYAIYGREVLKRLWQTGKFEVAEFACYISSQDERLRDIPWKVYPNLPNSDDVEQMNLYQQNTLNQFGQWKFEDVCLDFKPTVVCDIRDFWMIQHEEVSPFRPYYNLLWMPTVDAPNQEEQWLSSYANADGIFTYQDWSSELLRQESNGNIKPLCSAPPSASTIFTPNPNRKALKHQLGFGDYTIIGTVMRNQRRKLFPKLFAAFRTYLDRTEDTKTLLYCHTSYPDRGWDIPRLLMEYGLCSKTLFTYVCTNCKETFPSFFSDSMTYCLQCNKKSAGLSNVQRGVNNNILAGILNIFDLYIQYSNSEAMGMPQLEAAACGTPLMATDWSAMSSIVRDVNGIPIKVLTTELEVETGCERAIPDNEDLVQNLIKFKSLSKEEINAWRTKTREGFENNYGSWDDTAKKWENYIDNIDTDYYESKWYSPPNFFTPQPYSKINCSNRNYARWLIRNVLGDTNKLNSYMESRLIRDLNYNATVNHMSGMYFNELSSMFEPDKGHAPFNREEAYKKMENICNLRNFWEQKRCEKLNLQ